ncbi:MAG: flagellar basal body-associated FliL family protein [Maritimibacter sp.]
MADEEKPDDEGAEEAPKKKGKKGLVIGFVLALILGGGGFFAVYSGMILEAAEEEVVQEEVEADPLEPVAFVPLEPLVVSLGPNARLKYLKFQAQLEVTPSQEADVAKLVPRVMDVLNSYLRAVDVKDLEDPLALISLRAQMLRRIQLVTGEGRVRDLLIMEFVLN